MIKIILTLILITLSNKENVINKSERNYENSYFCCNNSLYNKDSILVLMASIMKEQVNRVKPNDNFEHGISEDGKSYGFFIYDIIDTTNYSKDGSVDFINKHIYHFSSINYRYHFSNICYLNNGEIILFKSLNCDNYGNNIQEVKNYFLQDSLYSKQYHVLLRLDQLDRFSIFFKRSKLTGVKCK